MPSSTRGQWEQAEIKRSAYEASLVDTDKLLSDEAQVVRYLDPPADTIYMLEYSFHLLGDVRGKTVLEYGCGDGLNTVILARRGARVIALDISKELIDVARQRLLVNKLETKVDFVVGSAYDIPMPDESVDVVFGMAILHHLELDSSAREVRRVLCKGGRAIFQEPLRNSRLIKTIRKMIPHQSPDVSPFERPLTDEELARYCDDFSTYRTRSFGLPSTNIVEAIPWLCKRFLPTCLGWDDAILQTFPSLSYYATARVVEVVK